MELFKFFLTWGGRSMFIAGAVIIYLTLTRMAQNV